MTSKSSSSLVNSLTQDLSSWLFNGNDHDIIIKVGENQNAKEFRAHSNFLRARSTYFKAALSDKWISKTNNNKPLVYEKPNINPNVFDIILKYIYTSEVDLTKQSVMDILDLLVASDELLLDELFKHVQEYLIKKKSIWIQKNLILVLNKVFTFSEKLYNHCDKFFLENPQSFFTSKDFPSLDKDILGKFLKRDDFLIEEIIIWENLIKWGIKQTPNLKSLNNNNNNNNITDWNKNDLESLKKTLSDFIPFIRFFGITSSDFHDKVRIYKDIIPKYKYEEAMELYMKNILPETTTLLPRGMIQIKSNIIKQNHAYVITNWIEGNDSKHVRNKKDSQYKFELLYSGSNNININTFRKKCNNQSPCLILIKPQNNFSEVVTTTQQTNNNMIQPTTSTLGDDIPSKQNLTKIYGEYNSHGFTNSRYNTTENFIFSLENGQDIKNMKMSRLNHTYENHSNKRLISPTFHLIGQTIRVEKLLNYDNNVSNVINSNLNLNLIPKEIEIFKVIRMNNEYNK